jgi:hypothetical protein
MKQVSVSIALLLLSSSAHALTGNKLYELCDSSAPAFQATCDGYAWGSSEGIILMNNWAAGISKDIKRLICPPEE